jgi:esterase/lipase superfamily enzyme
MLFITNRAFTEGNQTVIDRRISFDLNNNAPSNSVYFCCRNSLGDYREIGSQNFIQSIQNVNYEQILLYIHGFNSLPEEVIFPRAELLQFLFDQQQLGSVLVIPIIWPCDNDLGIVQDYWDDEKSSDMSAFSLARALCKFTEWSALQPRENLCLKRLNILAHSMGNRVLRESLRIWNQYDLARGVPQLFRNIFMTVADISNDSLNIGNPGESICRAAKNVCVYYAGDDWALRSSKMINPKEKLVSCRLGHTGPEDISKVPPNVYVFDCDPFNNIYDDPLGHTYFMTKDNTKVSSPGLLFQHIYSSLQTGRVFELNITSRSGILGAT